MTVSQIRPPAMAMSQKRSAIWRASSPAGSSADWAPEQLEQVPKHNHSASQRTAASFVIRALVLGTVDESIPPIDALAHKRARNRVVAPKLQFNGNGQCSCNLCAGFVICRAGRLRYRRSFVRLSRQPPVLRFTNYRDQSSDFLHFAAFDGVPKPSRKVPSPLQPASRRPSIGVGEGRAPKSCRRAARRSRTSRSGTRASGAVATPVL